MYKKGRVLSKMYVSVCIKYNINFVLFCFVCTKQAVENIPTKSLCSDEYHDELGEKTQSHILKHIHNNFVKVFYFFLIQLNRLKSKDNKIKSMFVCNVYDVEKCSIKQQFFNSLHQVCHQHKQAISIVVAAFVFIYNFCYAAQYT